MTTPFDRPLYGYRFVLTQYGDTLPSVAARELDDAGRWAEIIVLNSMVYPYLTDDPTQVVAGVFLTGTYITIPASAPAADSTDPANVFLQDILITNGQPSFVNGDFQMVSGINNLNQALNNALATDEGDLIYHTDYGNELYRVRGSMNSSAELLLAAQYASDVVGADSRIDSVISSVGTASGDAIIVILNAQTIQGTPITIKPTL